MNHPGMFAEQLRYWRRARGRTQLDLSMSAGYSQRHLSFLESGRSRPSRETVIALSDCLDVPLRERNRLLHAAGFAPVYSDEPIESARLQEARRAVENVLYNHRPFPALLVDRAWNTFGANACAGALFARFVHSPGSYDWDAGVNAIRLCIEDTGMKPYIDNLGSFLNNVLGQLRTELQRALVHEELSDLVADIETSLHSLDVASTPAQNALPVGCLRLRREDAALALFTMVSTFNFPLDATIAELRVETFFPADEATRAYLLAMDETVGSATAQV